MPISLWARRTGCCRWIAAGLLSRLISFGAGRASSGTLRGRRGFVGAVVLIAATGPTGTLLLRVRLFVILVPFAAMMGRLGPRAAGSLSSGRSFAAATALHTVCERNSDAKTHTDRRH